LKKIEKPIYVRNMDRSFNKERPIEHIVEVNIYYQGHRERTEIDVIGEQKWSVILGMPWLACHNPEINWRTRENKGGEDNKISGRVWEVVETEAGKGRVAEAEKRREKGEGGKITERKGNRKETKKEKTEGRKDNRCKESD